MSAAQTLYDQYIFPRTCFTGHVTLCIHRAAGHVERVFRSLDDATEADWSEVKDSADIKTQICHKADELAETAR